MTKTARNPITNDLIKSKNSNETFDKNFDQIDWSVKLEPAKKEDVERIIEEVIADHGDLLKELKD
jgi:hypothetical protein